jgi:hypothetical protein
MIWTDERKRKVLDHLKKVNEALKKALEAVARRDQAGAGEHILDAVAEKHRAIEDFPPIQVGPGKTISMGGLFRLFENKEMLLSRALYAGSIEALAWLLPAIIEGLRSLISQFLGLVIKEWSNQEAQELLRKIEKALRELKSFLDLGTTDFKTLWAILGDIRRYQAEFLDTAFDDKNHGISEVFLGLIDLDARLAGVLDKLSEWEREQNAGTESGPDMALYLKNILDIAKENKEEIEEKIRGFAY